MRGLPVLVSLLVVLLLPGPASAQTVVAPVDARSVIHYYTSSRTTTVFPVFGLYTTFSTEARFFAEFSLFPYGPVPSASLYFVVYPYTTTAGGPFYVRPMTTAGEDGSVTTGDFSRIGAPIWTGTMASTGLQTFNVPITGWFNAHAGGFGGLALTGKPGTVGFTLGGALILNPAAVPEPGTLALFGLGLLSMVAGARLRRKRR